MVYHLSGNSADHPDLSSAERSNATALPNAFSREPFLRNSDRPLKYISSVVDLGQSVGAVVIADETAHATIGTQLNDARARSVWALTAQELLKPSLQSHISERRMRQPHLVIARRRTR
jgi:hypothetical protein